MQLEFTFIALLTACGTILAAGETLNSLQAAEGWPEVVRSIKYPASIDDSQQPMLVYAAQSDEKRPLLVGLHTWSGGYKQAGGEAVCARWCIENDWHFVHPDFRGPNWTADACGSDKAVQDIIDAVEYMKKYHKVDADRIYLVGASGGGHAAILMAGRAPDLWAGVSSWVPISDIRAWWKQKREGKHSGYADHIEKAVGGRPDQNGDAAQECVARSPLTYLEKAAAVNLDINAGITDGHEGGSVPFTHSLHAFNQVVSEEQRVSDDFINTFYEEQQLPPGTPEAGLDALYGSKPVVFRRTSEHTRVTIFQGGHEIIHEAALNWLAKQRKGKPANWNVTAERAFKTVDNESQSGQ